LKSEGKLRGKASINHLSTFFFFFSPFSNSKGEEDEMVGLPLIICPLICLSIFFVFEVGKLFFFFFKLKGEGAKVKIQSVTYFFVVFQVERVK
jgi:hypothetical protein